MKTLTFIPPPAPPQNKLLRQEAFVIRLEAVMRVLYKVVHPLAPCRFMTLNWQLKLNQSGLFGRAAVLGKAGIEGDVCRKFTRCLALYFNYVSVSFTRQIHWVL